MDPGRRAGGGCLALRSSLHASTALSHAGGEQLLCVSLGPFLLYTEPSLGPFVALPRGTETASDLHWRHTRRCGRAHPQIGLEV